MATHAARTAGALLRERVDSIHEIRHKSAVDLVTDVDLQSEREVRSIILAAFPTHTILGEEGGTHVGSEPRFRWIIDPLDGTTNYAHGFPFFCVSIGLEIEANLVLGVVYAPILDELFVGQTGGGATLNGRPLRVSSIDQLTQSLLATGFPYERSRLPRALRSFEAVSFRSQAVRRVGSAALDICYVACGRLDGYWEHHVNAWDLAAGTVLVREAGGMVTHTTGAPFSVDAGEVLATNGRLHSALVETLSQL